MQILKVNECSDRSEAHVKGESEVEARKKGNGWSVEIATLLSFSGVYLLSICGQSFFESSRIITSSLPITETI